MTHTPTPGKRDRVIEFLRRVTRFSVIEGATELAQNGSVVECSRAGPDIIGIVCLPNPGQGEENNSVRLAVDSAESIKATCSCCSKEEMDEQWCQHAVALLLRAQQLGFLELDSGFASNESTIRMNLSSPDEIARVIQDISAISPAQSPSRSFNPHVTIILDHSSDRLGVQLQFDGEIQGPSILEHGAKRSSRTLDNLLFELLDEKSAWDSDSKQWFVNSSREIEVVIGLVREYRDVVSRSSGRSIAFSEQMIDARLNIEWNQTGAELSMEWILPNGEHRFKQEELIGSGPYWVVIGNTIYRLTTAATRIASMFPRSAQLNLTRSQLGPVLSALNTALIDERTILVKNPEEQPASKVVSPNPSLKISRIERSADHFTSSTIIELSAILDFNYPVPPTGSKVIYLPSPKEEMEYTDQLRSLGFRPSGERSVYVITGDAALDLIESSGSAFKTPWRVSGLDGLKRTLKFVDLKVKISVGGAERDGRAASKGRIDWFDCYASLSQNNANIPLSNLFKSVKSDQDRWVRLDNGAWGRIPGGSAQQLKATLGLLDPNYRLSNNIRSRISTAQALGFCKGDESGLEVTLDKSLEALRGKLADFTAISAAKASKRFKGKLRSYQREGLGWLQFLREFGLSGILADEMGLGKTVQALALLQEVHSETDTPATKSKAKKTVKRSPSLVVAPTSVMMNWVYEARRFTPNLKVLLLHGPLRKQHFSNLAQYDLVITSYTLLRLDRADLEQHEFEYLILDEAQNIKNPQTSTTRAAKALRAANRLALTGTPTENRPLELWSIFDFLMPGYLGNLEFFKANIERPIIESQASAQVTKFLNSKTRPFIMRRLKSEVERELPPKIESDLHVVMTESQRQLYNQILEEVRPRVFDAVTKKGVKGASVSILAALLRLRQVCNHPSSIEALKEIEGYDSGKFDLLQELVEEAIENGRKILLFSQFKEMLAIIRRWLDTTAIKHLYLDGATRNRQELIDQFTYDDSVRMFLISLKAGGTGLNLAAADTVILYDPWWNPAVESQAIDRAHRIGQSKTVNVYRLITENSIEQKIMDLKARKSKIADALVNENGLSTLSLTKTDLDSLFAPVGEASAELMGSGNE